MGIIWDDGDELVDEDQLFVFLFLVGFYYGGKIGLFFDNSLVMFLIDQFMMLFFIIYMEQLRMVNLVVVCVQVIECFSFCVLDINKFFFLVLFEGEVQDCVGLLNVQLRVLVNR